MEAIPRMYAWVIRRRTSDVIKCWFWGGIVEAVRQIQEVLCGMDRIYLVVVGVVLVDSGNLWYSAGNVLFSASTTWLLIFASQMT